MSNLSCPEGARLLNNLAEAMCLQCELASQSKSPYEIALNMDTSEVVQYAADHLMRCPICRTH